MKRLLSKVSLARLALAAWLAWLVTIVITAWLSLSGVLHPSFLYMVTPLAFMLFCTLVLVLGGIWRIARGPGRYRAVVWILVGVLPGLLTAAYVEHLFLLASGRGARLTWSVRASTAVASLVAEPYIRVCYPHRHEGRRCVMWSASSERNDVVLAQMDAHIEHMETLLGERSDDKAYWVRGPVWGLGGRYGAGWVLGSAEHEYDSSIKPVDWHEAAHFALNQLLPPDHELPALFQEGWAELHTGGGGTSNWREFWLNLRNGKSLSLRELLSRDSYYRAEVPTYQQGCVLVDHLLRRFGHAKFLEFCQTCREATFDEDLRRVFGVSLDELDESYKQEPAQYNSVAQWYFMSLKLAEEVDPDQWRQLIEDYCEGTKRLQMAFRQSSVQVRDISETFGSDEEPRSDQCQNLQFYRDGERNATINGDRNAGPCNVGIRTSLVSFAVGKEKAGALWRLIYHHYTTGDGLDFDIAVAMNRQVPPYFEHVLLPMYEDAAAVTIKSIGPSPVDARLVRISYSRWYPGQDEAAVSGGWWDIDPRFDFGVVGGERYFTPDVRGRTTVEYQTIDGHTAPKTCRNETFRPDGVVQWRSTSEITSCKFGPPPPEVFELSSYGDLRPEDAAELVEPIHGSERVDRKIGPAAWTAFGWTIATVLAGLVLPIRRAFGGR